MSNKGYRRHKCKSCGKLRSTAGDFCDGCIIIRLETMRELGDKIRKSLDYGKKM